MKKSINVVALVSMFAWAVMPTLVAAQEITTNTNTSSVGTGFTRSAPGGEPPVVKVKWEMLAGTQGADDSTAAGSQVLPPVEFEGTTGVTYCAVATDENGVDDLNAVYADLYFPDGIGIHAIDTEIEGEYGTPGCSEQSGDEIQLSKLPKMEGWTLLCDAIREGNTNLPVWAEGFDYDEVCRADGELMKETAAVYCGTRSLWYEDPAGDYSVKVFAQDKAGNSSVILENTLTYLPVTAFETDFTYVDYGKIVLNSHKIKNGDLTWGTSLFPTVRNIGNTRLNMTVTQDDMKLGSTDGKWNVKYDGRVGSEATFAVYDPNVTTTLQKTLDLSETNEMDFSVTVYKFPTAYTTDTVYTGTMVLGANFAPFRQCLQR